MRTVAVTVYRFDELSDKAKERAYYDWLRSDPYPWAGDNAAVLKEFEKTFPVRVTHWEYESYHYDVRFTFDPSYEHVKHLSGIRLLKYIYNNYYNDLYKKRCYFKSKVVDGKVIYKRRYSQIFRDNSCVLTGYWLDNDTLAPVYAFLKKPNSNITFYALMEQCLDAWGYACMLDYRYYTSMEYFEEYCNDNNIEFLKCGSIFNGYCY